MMMKWHIFVTIILIQLKTFHCNTIELSSYSRVAKNGNANEQLHKNTDQPTIHRAREGVINSDLWQPKTSNDTKMEKSTGRSIDDSRPFPFPLKSAVYASYEKPSLHRSSHEPRVVYASSPVQQIAQDRFVPRESLDHFIEKNNRNRFKSSIKESDREDDSVPQVDAPASDYKPPAQLYSFPPNHASNYPPPENRKPISVSSYLPPPSGPSEFPIYPGPIMSKPVSSLNTQADNSDPSDMDDMKADMDDDKSNMDNGNSDRPSDDMKFIDKPSSGYLPSDKPDYPSISFLDHDPHDHSHDHDPHDHSHDHHHEDHHHEDHHHEDHHHDEHILDHPPYSPYDDSLKHLHGFDVYPEVIFDDPHHDFLDDHHHFHHDHPPPLPPPPPPTTPPPPPPPPVEIEEPEQPRVKKYSYFYLSRSLWYIPLYFTVWFTFYVTWLILQSIGRHKVDLPNHTVNRRSVRDLTHKETVDKVNVLTEFVMSQIDDFKEKYL